MVTLRQVFRVCALIAALASPAAFASPVAFRIADIETNVDTRGSSMPFVQARLGDWVYFSAADALHGQELWRTDGTAAGTQMVADLCPGRCSSWPLFITATAGRLLFTAELELLGREPWTSDGTRAGTRALGDLCPGPCSSVGFGAPLRAVTVADTALTLFVASEPAGGRELWRTDGTPAGTARVADLWPGPNGSAPDTLTELAGRVYFAASEPAHGLELWSSDGTEAGTRLVNDFANGPFGSQVALLGAIDSGLLLRATIGTATDLWVVQPSGQLRPLGNPPCHIDCGFLEVEGVGDWMAVSSGGALWWTDLSPTGTLRLATPASQHNSDYFAPQELTRIGDRVFFRANNTDLWVSDGTVTGTRMVRRLSAEGVSWGPFNFTALGDDAIFGTYSAAFGHEPWVTDGTEAGTRILDLAPGPASSLPLYERYPRSFMPLAGRVLFSAGTPETGRELWITDDSPAGAHLLSDIYRDAGSNPGGLATWQGRLHFSAWREGFGFDPWTSDGTAEGTTLLRDLPEQSWPSVERVPFAGHLYFAAADPPVHDQVWRTDGTTAGTVPLDGNDGSAHGFAVLGSRLLLLANPEGQDCHESDCSELMALDAGADEVSLVAEINPTYLGDFGFYPPVPASSWVHDVTVLGSRVVFSADDGASGQELWTSDGTTAGTRLLVDLCPDWCSSDPRDFVRLADHVLFTTGGYFGRAQQLWRTDGTAPGTIALRTFGPVDTSHAPLGSLQVAGEHAFFLVTTTTGDELWTTDGTAAGTVRTSHLALDGTPAQARRLTAVDGRLYLAVYHGSTGEELWTSDGTPAGTRLVADLAPGAESSSPDALTAVDGLLLFAAGDGVSGVEPWVSDGSAGGTRRLQDVAAGAESSSPAEFTRFGDLLVFTAGDSEHGREPWAARLADVTAGRCRSTATTLCLQDGRFAVTARWKTAAGSGDGHPVPRTDESGTFWFFDDANTELIVKVLDGSAVNGRFWVFFNSLSDVEYDVEVVEAATGARRTYHHAQGNLCGQADIGAFPVAAAGAAASGAADAAATIASSAPRTTSMPAPLAAVDGAAGFAAPAPIEAACAASATTLCLQNGRFAVEVDFLDPLHSGAVTPALAIPDGEESGLFSFFGGANFELGVKVLDGRPVNGRHWLFHAALTDIDYTLRATDTSTGTTRTYHHAPGQLCGGADTSAF